MRRIVLFVSVILLNCLSIVFAEERDSHFAMSIGRTDIKGDIYHHQGTIFRMLGGQRFNDYISLEAGFIYYGEVEDNAGLDEMKIEGHAWDINLVVIAPLSNVFEAFGKVGASRWSFRGREEVSGVGAFRGKVDGEDPVYGAGFLFNVDHDSTIRLEYELSEFDDTDVKIISLGFQHRY